MKKRKMAFGVAAGAFAVLTGVAFGAALPQNVTVHADTQSFNRTTGDEYLAADWSAQKEKTLRFQNFTGTGVSLAYKEKLTGAYSVEFEYAASYRQGTQDLLAVFGAAGAEKDEATFQADTDKLIVARNPWTLPLYPNDVAALNGADGQTPDSNGVAAVSPTEWDARYFFKMKFSVQANGDIHCYYDAQDGNLTTLRNVIAFGEGVNDAFAYTDGYFHFAPSAEASPEVPFVFDLYGISVTTADGTKHEADFADLSGSGWQLYGGEHASVNYVGANELIDVKNDKLVSTFRLGDAGLQDGELVFDLSYVLKRNGLQNTGCQWGMLWGMSSPDDTNFGKDVGSLLLDFQTINICKGSGVDGDYGVQEAVPANCGGYLCWESLPLSVTMKGYKGGKLDLTLQVGTQREEKTYTGMNFNGYIGFYVNRAAGHDEEKTWWLKVEDLQLKGNECVTVTAHDGVSQSAHSVQKNAPVSIAQPDKTGYTFEGWATRSGEEGSYVYTDYDTAAPIRSDLDLYAQWEAVAYAIDYELSGGTNAPSNPATYTIENQTIVLAEPTREGYAFEGWMNAQNETVTEIAAGSTGDVLLRAVWSAVPYTISYELNGGTNAAGNPVTYTVESEAIALADPVREGYEFKGWYLGEDFAGNSVSQIATGTTGNLTLHARWERPTYTISYELSGGTNAVGNPATYTVESGAITFADPVREGYAFEGWVNAQNERVTEIAAGSTGNVSLRAVWSAVTYTISYVLNDGTNADGNPVTYTVESGAIALVDPVREGYEFKGWYFDEEFAGNSVSQIATGTTGNLTLYAKWEKIQTGCAGSTTAVPVALALVAVAACAVFIYRKRKNDDFDV